MSVEQIFTKLRKGTKQQRHLLTAKLYVFSSLAFAFASLLELAARHWPLALMLASFAVLYSCIAFAQYMLSHKTGGE